MAGGLALGGLHYAGVISGMEYNISTQASNG